MSVNLKKVEELYTNNLKEFGIDSRSVGWNSPESQEMRFLQMAKVIDKSQESISINELGCGYGEFYKYLKDANYPVSEFIGYDISQAMLDAAREYLGEDEAVKLVHHDQVNQMADYTFTSGIFNVRFKEDPEAWINYIKDTLKCMYNNSRKGIAFNLLTKYVDFEAENLYYADPAFYFDFCKTELSRYVTLVHDYPLYEWTLLVKKEEA